VQWEYYNNSGCFQQPGHPKPAISPVFPGIFKAAALCTASNNVCPNSPLKRKPAGKKILASKSAKGRTSRKKEKDAAHTTPFSEIFCNYSAPQKTDEIRTESLLAERFQKFSGVLNRYNIFLYPAAASFRVSPRTIHSGMLLSVFHSPSGI
jgi:hypothetical protein